MDSLNNLSHICFIVYFFRCFIMEFIDGTSYYSSFNFRSGFHPIIFKIKMSCINSLITTYRQVIGQHRSCRSKGNKYQRIFR